jgi:hypothetical protein
MVEPSPDDRYVIHKVFSSEMELSGSKLVRAELIEKETGRVLCVLTRDDIGTRGAARRRGHLVARFKARPVSRAI